MLTKCFLTLCFSAVSLIVVSSQASDPIPAHTIVLTENEYAVFHKATAAGVDEFNTWSEYSVRLDKNADAVLQWTVTFDNPKVLEVVEYWMEKQSAALIDAIDVSAVGQVELVAINTVQSLNRKIEASLANPIWPMSEVSGVVTFGEPAADGATMAVLTLEEPNEYASDGKFSLVSCTPLDQWAEKPVIVNGYITQQGRFEMTRIRALRRNTAELVIMSQCPFGTQAARRVLPYLVSSTDHDTTLSDQPVVEIRYLFYKRLTDEARKDGEFAWWCLHGDAELHENLVQMVIRDAFPEQFAPYLQARLDDAAADWQALAQSVGLTSAEVASIDEEITTNREALIEAEHNYVSNTLGISDGSPTWVWESRQTRDISAIGPFAKLGASDEKCAGGKETP